MFFFYKKVTLNLTFNLMVVPGYREERLLWDFLLHNLSSPGKVEKQSFREGEKVILFP